MSEFDLRPDPSDDPLDQLLREAEWPVPDADTVNRLRRHWESIRTVERQRQQRRRRFVYSLAATAAAVVLIVGVWWLAPPAPNEARPVAPAPPEPRAEQLAADEGTGARAADSPEAVVHDEAVVSSQTSRPATPYELLVIRSMERRSAIPRVEAAPTVDSMIDGFLSEPDPDASAFVASLTVDRATCERKLLELLDSVTADERTRIIQLLEHVGSGRCVPRLIELTRSPEGRSDAIRALTVLADPETLATLARRESDEQIRRQLLAELLARQSDEALAAWLDLLADARTRDAALVVLDEQTMPPVERLFEFMRGADGSRRWAAAVVLGRLDQPDVTERLIRLARSNVHRQEALAGLIASRDEQAGRFLTAAAQDQTMVGAVYSAQLQLRLLSQQSPSQQRWRNLP